jgi:hypothetical protein
MDVRQTLRPLFESDLARIVGKGIVAAATIAVAVSALVVSCQAKNQQASDAAKLRDLQNKSYGLEQQQIDSSKSSLTFAQVGIRLEYPSLAGQDLTIKEYPSDFEGAADTIPEDEWKLAANKRWIFAHIVNSGGKGIGITEFALRLSEAETTPLHSRPTCYSRLPLETADETPCPDFLRPGKSMVVYIGLQDAELALIPESQRQRGVEPCVNTGQANGVLVCGRQSNLKLPKYALIGGQAQAGAPK